MRNTVEPLLLDTSIPGTQSLSRKDAHIVFVSISSIEVDCEQSLVFFRFSKGSARAHERWAVKPPDARHEVSSLQSHAWSFACLGRFAQRIKKKERLLVVYYRRGTPIQGIGKGTFFWVPKPGFNLYSGDTLALKK